MTIHLHLDSISHRQSLNCDGIVAATDSITRQPLMCVQEQYPGRFQPRALELIAKRISAATGDMRTALAVCNAACTAAVRGATQASSVDATVDVHSHSLGQQATCESGGAETKLDLISVSQAAEALRVCSSGGSAQAQVCIYLHRWS